MAEDYAERRQHQRIDAVQAIFIEVVARGSRHESENNIMMCKTVDISVAGLRVRVPEAIPQGSRLNIAVPLDDWKENLELEGEAIWVKPVEEGEGYWVGLRLGDSSHEDMEKWSRVVHSLSR
jgi:c-di-GMP-binding flagellar brake protein YcgR